MVSIGQKLSLQQSQLSLQKKTAQTENSTENNAVVNQASINESKGGNFVPLNQIDTGSLLANNGVKINKGDTVNKNDDATITADAVWLKDGECEEGQGAIISDGSQVRVGDVVFFDNGAYRVSIDSNGDLCMIKAVVQKADFESDRGHIRSYT